MRTRLAVLLTAAALGFAVVAHPGRAVAAESPKPRSPGASFCGDVAWHAYYACDAIFGDDVDCDRFGANVFVTCILVFGP